MFENVHVITDIVDVAMETVVCIDWFPAGPVTGCNERCGQFFRIFEIIIFALLLLFVTECTLWRLHMAFLKC